MCDHSGLLASLYRPAGEDAMVARASGGNIPAGRLAIVVSAGVLVLATIAAAEEGRPSSLPSGSEWTQWGGDNSRNMVSRARNVPHVAR